MAGLAVPFDELKGMGPTPLGTSDWLVVDQERITRFADATEDHQWIHVDPARAAEGPFGTTIAHGYRTLSLVPRLLEDLLQVTDQVRGTSPNQVPGATTSLVSNEGGIMHTHSTLILGSA